MELKDLIFIWITGAAILMVLIIYLLHINKSKRKISVNDIFYCSMDFKTKEFLNQLKTKEMKQLKPKVTEFKNAFKSINVINGDFSEYNLIKKAPLLVKGIIEHRSQLIDGGTPEDSLTIISLDSLLDGLVDVVEEFEEGWRKNISLSKVIIWFDEHKKPLYGIDAHGKWFSANNSIEFDEKDIKATKSETIERLIPEVERRGFKADVKYFHMKHGKKTDAVMHVKSNLFFIRDQEIGFNNCGFILSHGVWATPIAEEEKCECSCSSIMDFNINQLEDIIPFKLDTKKDIEEFKHEVGKVYKNADSLIMCTSSEGMDNDCFSGFGFNNGSFYNLNDDIFDAWLKECYTKEVTQEEWQAALKKYADKKYLGKKAKSLINGIEVIVKSFDEYCHNGLLEGQLWYNGGYICLMDEKGNWAEIVEEEKKDNTEDRINELVKYVESEFPGKKVEIVVTDKGLTFKELYDVCHDRPPMINFTDCLGNHWINKHLEVNPNIIWNGSKEGFLNGECKCKNS